MLYALRSVSDKDFCKEDLAEGQPSLCCSAYVRATLGENISEEGRVSTFWNFKTPQVLHCHECHRN